MPLTLILGPMKSGKSIELIAHFAPLKYTDIPFALYHSVRNVRDEHISTRHGISMDSEKVPSLKEIAENNHEVIGIDEMHMFEVQDADIIEQLLKRGVKVVVSGLDTDYQGRMFAVIKRLLELGPAEAKFKRAVCESCRSPDAIYTQVLRGTEPILEGMPPVIPEDGTFNYKPVCRKCFVRKQRMDEEQK